ncbi:MAG: hypothetical protein IKX67_07665 [Bacteroidales bacterium]|nr:hypothetical protein [Bacteroidales bacterium]
MKKIRLSVGLAISALVCLASCNKEAVIDSLPSDDSSKIEVFLTAFCEQGSKVSLDFEQEPNVKWSDNDIIAVFDGQYKNQFSIETGSNTGASATFTGMASPGVSLYTVYPYEAGNSLSGSNLSVTIPANQVIGKQACVDTTAIVSVGKVEAGKVEFKQVCGLVKIVISGGGVRKIIISGNNLAGTANVAADGSVASVSSGSNSIELSYEGNVNFPAGTYYAAVLPGTTAAGSFSVQLVGGGGLTWDKTASSAVTIARKKVMNAGEVDSDASFVRHITNKNELYAWGEVMGKESGVTVYLDADIDCAADPWIGTGATFDGTFEGQGHKIYNLVVTYDGDTGFISRLSGTLKDVTFGSSNGSSWDKTSCITHNGMSEADADTHYLGLIGRMVGKGNMENVINYTNIVASTTSSRVYIGGLVGLIPGNESVTMTSCKNYGSVTNNSTWAGGQTRMGGIVGQCSGTLEAIDLENHGALTVNNGVTNFVGGLCGDLGSDSSITEASNYGTITFTDGGTQKTYIGGCFGSVRSAIVMSCHNYAPITITRNAEHWFGGIAGYMESGESNLMECINHEGANLAVDASVAKRAIMGGIAGGCQYNGSGPFAVAIEECKNEAALTNYGAATDFGGIAGLLDNYLASATILIQNCENTGAVASAVFDDGSGLNRELRMGGIVGGTDPEDEGCDQIIRSCVNHGEVTTAGALKKGASVRVGGIVGNTYSNVKIDKCKNFGDVGCPNAGIDAGSARFTCGGIAGYIHSRSSSRYQEITDCVNVGTISSAREKGTQYIGGIVGGGEKQDAQPYAQISGCKNYGEVSAVKTTDTLVGGLCGYTIYTISNSSNFANVTGGAWNGAIVGDGNSNAVMVDGIKVGVDVEVSGAANPGAKYTEGKKTYTFTKSASLEKQWFSGWADGAAITVTVVNQESYTE